MIENLSLSARTCRLLLLLGAALCLLPPALAYDVSTVTVAAPQQSACNGTFSDGTSIDIGSIKNMADVPGSQSFCDFHTFAWNQFIYLTQSATPEAPPPFLKLAPWYNVLGKPKPGSFPGGDTSLRAGMLSKGQAGTNDQLKDVLNAVVLFDIRFSQAMYDGIVKGGLS